MRVKYIRHFAAKGFIDDEISQQSFRTPDAKESLAALLDLTGPDSITVI